MNYFLILDLNNFVFNLKTIDFFQISNNFSYSNTKSTTDLTKRSYTADKSKITERKFVDQSISNKNIEERISALNNRREDYKKVLERDRSYSALRQ